LSESLGAVYLARHGETAWTLSGQHTGRTDLALTEKGERDARQLGIRLRQLELQRILTSPLQRARRTCELAALPKPAQIDPDLMEWDYGSYEGLRTAEIRMQRPHWNIFRDGCPDGESPLDVTRRAERVIQRLREQRSNTLIFSSGHFLRVLAACWLGLDTSAARYWILGTASLSALGYEHDASEPVIRSWNDTTHGTARPAI
jgi:probable phosphoglycerate mutase